MSEGYPLLTTKKMAFKTMVTELLWFLRGDTNIKYLVDNGCNIWNGDCYKAFKSTFSPTPGIQSSLPSQEEFINKIKTDDEFAKKWGELGPIYGNNGEDGLKRKCIYQQMVHMKTFMMKLTKRLLTKSKS
jgi:thymidylate synthase